MKSALIIGAAAAALVGGSAQAAELVIDGVVARVEVVPEARGDIAVEVRPGSARLPAPRVRRAGDRVFVESDLDTRRCNVDDGRMRVDVRGHGEFDTAQLPTILVRAPRSVTVTTRNSAVTGRVGPAQDLSLSSGGCSSWTIADVAGTLRLDQSGGSNARAGNARSARLGASGGGSIRMGAVSDLKAGASGGGVIRVASVSGPAELDASGGAGVSVEGGRTGLLRADASGAAWIDYKGTAEGLDAEASGAAWVKVARVTGPNVRRSSSGLGRVEIGR